MLGLSDRPPDAPPDAPPPAPLQAERKRVRLILAFGALAALALLLLLRSTLLWRPAPVFRASAGVPRYGAATRTMRTVHTTFDVEIVEPEDGQTIIRLTQDTRPGCALILRSDDLARQFGAMRVVEAEIADYDLDGRRPRYELRRLGPAVGTYDLQRVDAAGCLPW